MAFITLPVFLEIAVVCAFDDGGAVFVYDQCHSPVGDINILTETMKLPNEFVLCNSYYFRNRLHVHIVTVLHTP